MNVPIVINVSLRTFPSFGWYNDFTASLICDFRFASSIARLLATARLAAGAVVVGAGLAVPDPEPPFFFFPGGCTASSPPGVPPASFRFLDLPLLLAGALARRRSIVSLIRSSSSGPGLSIRTSSRRSNFFAHCGQTSSCAPPSSPLAG